ncbi:MAG: hypothetical protein CVU56_13805 [Deltaproteobacteria bacterium HGW-Deltaproteobacteria-14]|nr:MAG: hypothetical protein CVU56_13805 [Deltaproteobacteria bacterium HGW-Deltaproteobacteria-14]
MAVAVQALELPDIVDVIYHLRVEATDGAPVWERTVRASDFGAGGGLTYVGPCDADPDAQPNRVLLDVVDLEDASGPLAAGSWLNPTATAALVREIVCVANADQAVSFDITVARRAQQGFFDIAVQFSDFFCSAKADCVDDHGDLLRLVFGPDGSRWPTTVVAIACTSGEAGVPVELYLTDPELTCANGTTPIAIDRGPGNLYSDAAPAPFPIAQAMAFPAVGSLPGQAAGAPMPWLHLAVAVALDPAAAGPCTLVTQFTAVNAGATLPMTLSGTTHPVIDVLVPILDANGARACARHALDAGDGVVATRYTGPNTPETFPTGVVALGPSVSVTRTCVADCEAAACGPDQCGGVCGVCVIGAACDPTRQCAVEWPPTCFDAATNEDETGPDCGGSCPPCGDGLGCQAPADCASGVCDLGVCQAPACDDAIANGDELGVDCGGACPACAVAVSGVELPASATVEVGRQITLSATVLPGDAANRAVTWQSVTPAVATVSAAGVVTGVAVGSVDVVVTTVDGGFTATTSVTVTPRVSRAYTGVSAAGYYAYSSQPTCNAGNLLSTSAWTGLARSVSGTQNVGNTSVNGRLVSSCAYVTFTQARVVTAVSVTHRTTTGSTQTCGDTCTTLCGELGGSGLVFVRPQGTTIPAGWTYIGALPSTTTVTATKRSVATTTPIIGVMVCRDSGGDHRDNIEARNVVLWD